VTTLVTITLTHMDCWNCHAIYGVDESARARWKAEGKSWFCPYCGKSTHYGTTDLDREKAARERAERNAQWHRERREEADRARVSAEHATRATKGHLTRLKRRVAAGVCPCCNRTFQDLSRHMAGQHPEYVEAPS
jgi:RNase P subunit RPR2